MVSDIGWVPKTQLGKMVLKGEIKSMSDALRSGLPLREPEIVDYLLPDLEDEVLDVNMVQRMTDSGRRVNFVITTVVGNGNGFVGLGRCRGKEVGPSIRKSIEIAKKNIFEIRRGCGSWECGCGQPHTLPFRVVGKSGSVEVTLKPAPQGVSLAVGDVAKHILRVAGVKDVWGFTKGHTKTTVNYALATFEALKATSVLKVTEGQKMSLKILTGAQPIFAETDIADEEEEPDEKEGAKAKEEPAVAKEGEPKGKPEKAEGKKVKKEPEEARKESKATKTGPSDAPPDKTKSAEMKARARTESKKVVEKGPDKVPRKGEKKTQAKEEADGK